MTTVPSSNSTRCLAPRTRYCGTSRGLFLLAAVLTSLVGCGPKSDLLGVTGEVILGGTPVKSGSIQLTSLGAGKVFATGAEIKDGEFDIPQAKGLPPGTYLIVISAADETAPRGAGGAARELIPAEYNANSQKTVDLAVDGENHFVFDIVSR